MVTKLSERTLVLLYATKNQLYDELQYEKLVSEALGELYHHNLAVSDCIHHCLHVVLEIQKEPRFQINSDAHSFIIDLLYSPYKQRMALGAKNLHISYGDFYKEVLGKLISIIQLTNIGWCDEYKEYAARRDSQREQEV